MKTDPEFTATETFLFVFVPVFHGCYGCCIIFASSIEEAANLLDEWDIGYDNTRYKLLEERPKDDGTMTWKRNNFYSFYLRQAIRVLEPQEHKVEFLSFGDTS